MKRNRHLLAPHLKGAPPRAKYRHMQDVMEWKANLKEHIADRAALLRKNTLQACQSIADRLSPGEYAAWWTSAPDDDRGFYNAAVDKLSELETAEIVAWLTPAGGDYDGLDPAVMAESNALNETITANWDTIPERSL